MKFFRMSAMRFLFSRRLSQDAHFEAWAAGGLPNLKLDRSESGIGDADVCVSRSERRIGNREHELMSELKLVIPRAATS